MYTEKIYHLVPQSEFRAQIDNSSYLPSRYDHDGFIHCTGEIETLLLVANDYFTTITEPLLALVIDPDRLIAEVRFEPPAPIAGGGTRHLKPNLLFPHIYGPLNVDAITAVGVLAKTHAGYGWPDRFVSIEQFIR